MRVDSMTSYQPSTSPAGDDRGKCIDPSVINLSKLSINPTLSNSQRTEIDALIRKLSDVFQWANSDLVSTHSIRHKISVTDDMPVAQPHRRISPAHLKEVQAHTEDLLR
ncbi:Pol polyprotein [Plakobranchus ocellatus]|uniref:Pol polyprotein n=1 Tax=Plakobranchus ocellatus TaxID=259542 RepID=A0AAV4CVW6_9GAST|nr:Pol polyprotein [Plakobranchus ocellatus]